MNLGFCPLASSSSGNCYFIRSDNTGILLDAGISASRIGESLHILGTDLADLNGVLITHEHIDHIKSVSTLVKRTRSAVFAATEGTLQSAGEKGLSIPEKRLIGVTKERVFTIGEIEVRAFAVSHDAAEPVAYAFCRNHRKIAVVTDTGKITEEIEEAIEDSDILVIESNHEVNILLYGRYPYNVKRRILSDKGHLSNEAAGNCICRFLKNNQREKAPYVFLAHISRENNTPEQAVLTVRNILEEEGLYVGRHLRLAAIAQREMGDMVLI